MNRANDAPDLAEALDQALAEQLPAVAAPDRESADLLRVRDAWPNR